jgi:hypothetical protein
MVTMIVIGRSGYSDLAGPAKKIVRTAAEIHAKKRFMGNPPLSLDDEKSTRALAFPGVSA